MRLALVIFFSLLTACGQHSQKSSGSRAGGDAREIGEARGEEAILLAIAADDAEKISTLLAEGWELEKRLRSGRTLLTEACAQLKLAIVALLVERGASLEIMDAEGRSAQSYAEEHPALARLIFPERVIAQERDLSEAVLANKFADVRRLLSGGLSANFRISEAHVREATTLASEHEGETPLTLAVKANLVNVLRTLLAPNVEIDVNLPNAKGESPWRLTRDLNLPALERLLVQRGAREE